MRQLAFLLTFVALSAVKALDAQESSARQIAQERAQAELDAPKLAEVLELKPGMTVADIGAGGGAMTVVLGKWIAPGHWRPFASTGKKKGSRMSP
jgi:predicted methyltransferase